MSLVDKINEDIKAAMLAKEKEKLEAIRAIKSALLLAQTSGETVSEEVEIKLLQRLVKQRRESAEIYKSQNREDLLKDEIFQAEIIEAYLPKQMSKDEIKVIIAGVIKETGVTNIKEMGKIMGIASKQLAGKADNKAISEVIKELLS